MNKLIYTLLLLAVGAYVLSPVDLVPDIFFGIGWLDDFALIAFAIRMVIVYNKSKKIKKTQKPSNKEDPIEVDFKDINETE